MTWTETLKMCLENLQGNTLYVDLDDYSPGDENKLKKTRPEIIKEREISDLSQQLPKSDE